METRCGNIIVSLEKGKELWKAEIMFPDRHVLAFDYGKTALETIILVQSSFGALQTEVKHALITITKMAKETKEGEEEKNATT